MARKQPARPAAAKRKRSIARLVFYALSVVIILSMTIGFVIDVIITPSGSGTVIPAPIVLPTAGPPQP
jgi:cell division septal protein FtsQ